VEGGHPGSGNAILNNAENLIIGEPLRSWVFRDVGRALATSRVKTVTLGAAASKYLLALAGEGMDWIILPLWLPKLFWHAEERTSRPQILPERRWARTFPLAVARRVFRIQSARRRAVGSAGSRLPIRGQNDTEKRECRDKSALLVTHSRYPAGKAATRLNTVPYCIFIQGKAFLGFESPAQAGTRVYRNRGRRVNPLLPLLVSVRARTAIASSLLGSRTFPRMRT
jgi:hypothetical protein